MSSAGAHQHRRFIHCAQSRRANLYSHAVPKSASRLPSVFSLRSRPSTCSRFTSRPTPRPYHRARCGKTLRPAFAIPQQIETVIAQERRYQKIARKYGKARDFLYLGRGINYPVALEGALKLKEISYIHAEGYSAGEMKHGPIALIDDEMPVVVIIPNDSVFDKTLSNLKEVESRNGRIIAITDHRTAELEEVAWDIIDVPATNRFLMPVLTTVPLQLLAYHIAVYRGTDVDQPRNLAKSVTVE